MPAGIYGLKGRAPAGSGLSGQRVPFSWESCLLLQKSDSRKYFLFFMFYFTLFQSSFHTMTHLDQCWIIPWAASVSSLNEIGYLATFQKMCHLIQHLNALPHTCPILIVSLGLSLRSSFILGLEMNLKCSMYSQSCIPANKDSYGKRWPCIHSMPRKKAWQHLSSYLFLLSSYMGKKPELWCNFDVEEV